MVEDASRGGASKDLLCGRDDWGVELVLWVFEVITKYTFVSIRVG